VKDNPALEDLELKSTLGAVVREVAGGPGRPALRVISNDDTDKTEIARLLVPEPERVTFASVGGLLDVKKQINRKIILPYKKPSVFQRFKRRTGGGILLYGPPGCGKTLLARATAGECDAAFFNVAISDVLYMYIGESERKLHALFENARSKAPAILFFDELEALAGKRQHTREATSSKLVSQVLSEMDGFSQNNAGVLILGATNVPWAVDAAFRRPGRFDRMLFVPPPDVEAREQIVERLLADRPVEKHVSPRELAKRTSGFSGADLKNLIESAVDEAIEASLDQGRDSMARRDDARPRSFVADHAARPGASESRSSRPERA
jgi:SpoVK/Ycf46/Vps4 family AAA+-type ATPase